ERVTLRLGQSLPQIEHRRAELMEACVRELHLVLDPCRSRDATPGSALHDVVQERRLADAGLAADDQDLAVTRSPLLQQPIEDVAFVLATAQHKTVSRHRPRRYL